MRCHILFFSILSWFFGAVFLLMSGCGVHYDLVEEVSTADRGGVTHLPALDLPFSSERSFMCVQGPGGSFSHRYRSTRHDLDLDTPNHRDELLFAPAVGVAYVHYSANNFGTHINIDQGDGTYAVLAHLSEVFVDDHQEVTRGQLLGVDGCTGACTGDHVHIGVHVGDASLPAEFGSSVPARYRIGTSTGTGARVQDADAFHCGLASAGDSKNGAYYRSVLDTPLAFPNGSLVKTAMDPRVYRIDNGVLRWITSEDVFHSYGYRFSDVLVVSEDARSCYPEGAPIAQRGEVRASSDHHGNMWLFVGPRERNDRYRIRVAQTGWRSLYASWGLLFAENERPAARDPMDPKLLQWPIRDGYARFRDGSLLKERSRSDVYVVSDGVALPVRDWDSFLFAGYSSENILVIEDEVLVGVQEQVYSCAHVSACVSREHLATCGHSYR